MLEEIEKNSIWGAGDATAPDVAERMEAFKETLLLPENNLILTKNKTCKDSYHAISTNENFL